MRARQRARGFFDGSLQSVNEREKTQARHRIAKHFLTEKIKISFMRADKAYIKETKFFLRGTTLLGGYNPPSRVPKKNCPYNGGLPFESNKRDAPFSRKLGDELYFIKRIGLHPPPILCILFAFMNLFPVNACIFYFSTRLLSNLTATATAKIKNNPPTPPRLIMLAQPETVPIKDTPK